MKKLLGLIAVMIGMVLTSSVQATEYLPYVAGRVSYVSMNNEADQWISNSGTKSTIVDKRLNDETWGTRLAVGVEVPLCGGLAKSVRTELEYGVIDDTHNSGTYSHNIGGFSIPTGYNIESKIQTIMLNVYYDLDTGTRFTPYVNAGVGYANIREKAGVSNQYASETAKDREDNFAWNVGAGVSYAINYNVSAELGYRYTDYGSVKNSDVQAGYASSAERDYDSHEIMLGLRYTF